MNDFRMSAGSPVEMGATASRDGVNFAVFSENAHRIELCLFSPDGKNQTAAIDLPERTGPIWHGFVHGLVPGALYGYRAHGPYAPERGHRFNANKLLLDPYSREIHGDWTHHDSLLGYDSTISSGDLVPDTRDSAPYVPKSVVSDPADFPRLERRPVNRGARDLVYEAHVKGLTQTHPDIPEPLRGSYEGLASDAMVTHLTSLGVGAIELLPIHAFLNDAFLLERGLTNYWGYNTIGFFAAEPRYFGPDGLKGFRRMVERLHEAGIEVILDVVYNHTAEGDHIGPTLCFRGLDNASYYRLIAGQPRYFVNDSGTGNTLNVSHPHVLRLVMDSLRFWVERMGVDGFRFDLATTLGREAHGFEPNGGFFDALRQDPILASVRLIAEPWDIGPGGYRLGEFPHDFAEWNDTYRDTVRRYWRGDAHSAQELAARLLGSADKFERPGRRATASINFVSAHDGFTLADATSFNQRHNEANTENNQDGHHSNFSDNCGVEGATDDPEVLDRRARRQRNMLATLFVSQGTPMLLAGDEFANSQGGNNNAYCQDNETGWLNWARADTGLTAFVRDLSAFRAAHPALRQTRFLHGAARPEDGLADVAWTDFSGAPLQWRDPGLSTLCLTLRCSAEAPAYEPQDDVVFVAFNRSDAEAEVTLPDRPEGKHWQRGIDTSLPDPAGCNGRTVQPQSVAAFVLVEGDSA